MFVHLPTLVVATVDVDRCVSNAVISRYDVRVACSPDDAIALATSHSHVEACVVDASLGDRACAAIIESLFELEPGLPVLLLAPDGDASAPIANELRVERIVSPLDLTTLAAALTRVERRALGYIARALRREFESRTADAQLTPQQEAISWMSVLGATAKEVAATRGVAVRTVETHRYEVLKKLNLATTESLRWQLLARVLPPWRAK